MAKTVGSKKAKKPSRRAQATRERIFAAALAEFAEAGFAGARVDAIARRSGANKALLYRYFGDKTKLYAATVAHVATLRRAAADAAPEEIGDRAAYWVRATARSELTLRFVLQEAARASRPGRAAALDRTHYDRQIHEVAERTPKDAALTLLALDALVTYPFAFPEITRAITGASVADAEFVERWAKFVLELTRSAFPARSPSEPSPGSQPLRRSRAPAPVSGVVSRR